MPAYIPMIFCGKCNTEVPYGSTTAMRVHSNKERYIRVRCHGEELKIGFADKPNQRVILWQERSVSPSESKSLPA